MATQDKKVHPAEANAALIQARRAAAKAFMRALRTSDLVFARGVAKECGVFISVEDCAEAAARTLKAAGRSPVEQSADAADAADKATLRVTGVLERAIEEGAGGDAAGTQELRAALKSIRRARATLSRVTGTLDAHAREEAGAAAAVRRGRAARRGA